MWALGPWSSATGPRALSCETRLAFRAQFLIWEPTQPHDWRWMPPTFALGNIRCYSCGTELDTSLVSCELPALLRIEFGLQYFWSAECQRRAQGYRPVYRDPDGKRTEAETQCLLQSYHLLISSDRQTWAPAAVAWHCQPERQKRLLTSISDMWSLLKGCLPQS